LLQPPSNRRPPARGLAMISRIYHYTTIDKLALILYSRKLRFSRLDMVDDVRESRTANGITFGKYFFVSCWTHDSAESIPLWQMYANQTTGVRIALPVYPFQRKPAVAPMAWKNVYIEDAPAGPLSLEELWGQSYMVLHPMKDENFAGEVHYVTNPQERYDTAITLAANPDGSHELKLGRPFDLVRLKENVWAFQKEYRFALMATPCRPLPPDGPGSPEFIGSIGTVAINSLLQSVDLGINHIDVDLAPDAFGEMVVTTGPLCTPGDR